MITKSSINSNEPPLIVRVLVGVLEIFGPNCEGKSIPPDRALRFPDGGLDGGSREGMDASPRPDGGVDGYTDVPCTPSVCLSEIIQRRDELDVRPICQQFAEVSIGTYAPTGHQGAVVGDINGDGLPDIILLNQDGHHQVFQNLGGHFNEITDQVNLPAIDVSKGILQDMNNDGTEDLVLAGSQGTYLYANANGNGRFEPYDGEEGIITPEASTSAAWIEDKLLVGTENGLRFYKNVSGRYIDSSNEMGLIDPFQAYGLAVADYNNDGRQDIFVANATGPNRLFRQKQDETFASVENDVGLQGIDPSVDATWIPWNSEFALYVANTNANNNAANQFFVHESGHFIDKAGDLSLQAIGNTTQVALNGSWPEYPAFYLVRENQENLYLIPEIQNGVLSHYYNVAQNLGINVSGQTVFAGWFDYNNDGRLDLLVVMANGGIYLYENQSFEMRECR